MNDRGQASLDYLGVVTLVAALVLAGGVAFGGADIAGGVVRQIHRALCIVSGGDCEADRRPCVVASGAREDGWQARVGLLRVGYRKALLIERRSDGTIAVTVVAESEGGLAVGAGAGRWIEAAGRKLAAGGAVRAALLAREGKAATWVFADEDSMRRAVGVLTLGGQPPGAPVERVSSEGLSVELEALGRSGFGRIRADDIAAIVDDERSGNVTVVLGRRVHVEGELKDRRVSGNAMAEGEERISITLDADGRPTALRRMRTGELGGDVTKLPAAVARLLEAAAPGRDLRGHRRWVVEEQLDLGPDGNLAAARSFVDEVLNPGARLPGTLPRASRALRERMDSEAIVDARTYAVDSDRGGSGIVELSAVGGGTENRDESTRLLEAMQRGLDGVWRRREDCVGPRGGAARTE